MCEVTTNGSASKNGHAIPTVNGVAFEEGSRVPVTGFDYEHSDLEFIEQQREIGRREALMDHLRILREGFDRISEDRNPVLGMDTYKYAAGISDETEVEIAARHGVNKAAVSKRVKQWQRIIGALGLPPSAAMRTEKACESFKKATSKSWQNRQKSPKRKSLMPVWVAPANQQKAP